MKELPITEFDMQTLPQFIQLAKAILPFMEFNTQQTLSPLLRAYEFSCTMNYYSRPESLRIAACSAKPHLSLNSPIQDILSDENIMNVVLTVQTILRISLVILRTITKCPICSTF